MAEAVPSLVRVVSPLIESIFTVLLAEIVNPRDEEVLQETRFLQVLCSAKTKENCFCCSLSKQFIMPTPMITIILVLQETFAHLRRTMGWPFIFYSNRYNLRGGLKCVSVKTRSGQFGAHGVNLNLMMASCTGR